MSHEALNEWLVEAQRVLEDQAKWEREFRYKFRNLGIGLGDTSGADSSKGDMA